MKSYIKIILFIFVSNYCFSFVPAESEEFKIHCTINNSKEIKKAYLYDYCFGKYNLIDTAEIKYGNFEFRLNSNSHPGIYKIRLSPERVIENIIFNYENIELSADYNRLEESLSFTKSEENKIFLEYNNFLYRERTKERALNYLLSYYTEQDKFYNDIRTELRHLSKSNREKVQTLIENSSKLMVGKLIYYEQIPLVISDTILKIEFLKEHFWDNFDFSDSLILYTPIFVSKIEDYFALYENPKLSRDEQEDVFKIPAEKILQKTQVKESTFSFTLEKILNDFEKYGLYNLYDFVAEKYLHELSCVNVKRLDDMKKKLEQIKTLAIGNMAIDFQITSKLNLFDIKKDFVLLIFWDSSCPFCLKTLSEFKSIYEGTESRNFEIVGISLDTNSSSFKKSILERGYSWISVCDFQGWNSSVVNDYNITATPTLFLLDKKKKIIARPMSVSQFLQKIKKAG